MSQFSSSQFLSLRDYRKFCSTETESPLELDILVPTFSGNFRGKRIATSDIEKLIRGRMSLPISVANMDVAGETPIHLAEGSVDGDPDAVHLPLRRTLRWVPWGERRAQVMLAMDDSDPPANDYRSPRKLLSRAISLFHEAKLYPQAAMELEFFLTSPVLDGSGLIVPAVSRMNARPLLAEQCLSAQNLEDFEPFLNELRLVLERQELHPGAFSAEYGCGQFEINQPHDRDLLYVCDQAMMLKHAVKSVARRHSMEATFMAKPYAHRVGSGMHVHLSLLDSEGANMFAGGAEDDDFSPMFMHALGGVIATSCDFFVMFAPFGNSYRRFSGGSFAPVNSAWGRNNRSVAFRVPLFFGSDDIRFEHRLAGADACPYLVMASLLFGVDYGLKESILPPRESIGDKLFAGGVLPLRWGEALYRFGESAIARSYLGETAHKFLHDYFASEYDSYHAYMSRRDCVRYFEGV